MAEDNGVFKELSQRLKDYKEQPDERLWQNIEKNINKKRINAVKTAVITGIVLLAGAITALIFAPAVTQSDNTASDTQKANITVQNKTADFQNKQTNTAIGVTPAQKEIVYKEKTENTAQLTEPVFDLTEPIKDVDITKQDDNIVIVQKQTANQQPAEQITKTNETNSENTEVIAKNSVKASDDTLSDSHSATEKLIVPNAFQPSSNDESLKIFKPFYKEVTSYEMQIFSRNGMKIFSTKDITIGWDGTIKGQPAEKGTYVYYLKYEDTEGKLHQQKGTLWLHR